MKTIIALIGSVWMSGQSIAADESVARGEKIYVTVGCYQCHGYQGQGGAAGPRLAPQPLPYDAFSAFIRTTDQIMPPYTAHVLAESDLEDIYAYLSAIPEPPEREAIPLLREK